MTAIEKWDLVMSKNDNICALQDITNWSINEVEDLWQFQVQQGRTCEIRKVLSVNGVEERT